MNEQSAPARSVGIDMVKAAAILGVLLLHTSTYGYGGQILSPQWTAAVLWGCAVRPSVPLFFMCSGALLLPAEKSLPLRRLWGRNILKIVVAMLFWAMFYKVFHLLASGALSGAALWQAVKEVLVFNQEFHFYFLHIILLVYAFLPVTRAFVQQADARLLRYALALWFALGILFPTLLPFWPFRLLNAIAGMWPIRQSFAAIGYGLLGYVLARRTPSYRIGALSALVGYLLIFVPTALLSWRNGSIETHFFEGMGVGACLLGAGLFTLLYRLGESLPAGRAAAAVTRLSKASFCIYLVHVVFLNVFEHFGLTAANYPAVLAVPVLAAANLLLSFLVWLILSRIPVVNRWLI